MLAPVQTPQPAAGAATPAAATVPAAGTAPAAGTTPAAGGTPAAQANGTVAAATDAKGYWPGDWRTNMATDAKGAVDDKLLKELERYDTPNAVNAARIEARARISAGLAPKELPANATAEEIAAYRAERGVPETHDKYDLTLPDGLVVGEADKPLIDNYLKAMHGEHATPAEVKRAVTWYYKQADAIRLQNEEVDAQFKKDNIDALRQQWGPEYRRNLQIYEEFKAGLPKEMQEALAGARSADGRLLLANATVLQWMVNQERARNPIATVVGGGGPGALAAAETELAALEKESADSNGPYWKGPEAQKKQARMRDLISAIDGAKQK